MLDKLNIKIPKLLLNKKINELKTEINAVFLTGSTGFIGSFILEELFLKTEAIIYCLIRGKDDNEAWLKLSSTIRNNHLCNDIIKHPRIRIVLGDLKKPLFKLKRNEFKQLSQSIQAIYHIGAEVNHILDYKNLKASNVLGTLEVIKLSIADSEGLVKPIYYMSSIEAAVDSKQGYIAEQFLSQKCAIKSLKNGYLQTKWVAERLLSVARKKGVPVCIYRPGWVLGHSQTGVCLLEGNHLLTLLRQCVEMRCAPDWKIKFNIIPVDFVSQFVVKSSLDLSCINKVFNLHDDTKVLSWECLLEWLGIQKICSPTVWKNRLALLSNSNYQRFPFFLIYSSEKLVQIGNIKYPVINKNTAWFLTYNKLKYPKIDKKLLDKYFNYILNQGFIDYSSVPANNIDEKLKPQHFSIDELRKEQIRGEKPLNSRKIVSKSLGKQAGTEYFAAFI